MKIKIKRDDFLGMIRRKFLKGKEIFFDFGKYQMNVYEYLPSEIELEISEADIVKEKSNREKWYEIFKKIGEQDTMEMAIVWAKDNSKLFDEAGLDATQAYEKIVEEK